MRKEDQETEKIDVGCIEGFQYDWEQWLKNASVAERSIAI